MMICYRASCDHANLIASWHLTSNFSAEGIVNATMLVATIRGFSALIKISGERAPIGMMGATINYRKRRC
jgi:hypothetical protein